MKRSTYKWLMKLGVLLIVSLLIYTRFGKNFSLIAVLEAFIFSIVFVVLNLFFESRFRKLILRRKRRKMRPIELMSGERLLTMVYASYLGHSTLVEGSLSLTSERVCFISRIQDLQPINFSWRFRDLESVKLEGSNVLLIKDIRGALFHFETEGGQEFLSLFRSATSV